MTLDAHAILGIAQTAFYTPILPLALWLLKRNFAYRPRMAWTPMCMLATIRLVGGPISIAFQFNETSVGLAIAAVTLLNVGAIPLIGTNLGFARAIFAHNFEQNTQNRRIDQIVHFVLVPPVVLLVVGGSLTASQPSLSRILTLLGYVVYAVLLIVMVIIQLGFWFNIKQMNHNSRMLLIAAWCAAPLIAIRIAYGMLEVWSAFSMSLLWNPVVGSALAFGLMALLPEYLALCIFMYAGYSIHVDREHEGTIPLDDNS